MRCSSSQTCFFSTSLPITCVLACDFKFVFCIHLCRVVFFHFPFFCVCLCRAGFFPFAHTRSCHYFTSFFTVAPLRHACGASCTLLAHCSCVSCRSHLSLPLQLDLHAVVWLEEYLRGYENTVIVVSHARDFLNSVVTDILELDQKKLTR